MAKLLKRDRKTMLIEQHNRCALCRHEFSVDRQSCYDATGHTLVCRTCLMLLSAFRAASVNMGEDIITRLVEYQDEHRGAPA